MSVTLLVGTRKGLFQLHSDDRRSWQLEGPTLEGWDVFHAIVDPRDRTLYAAANTFPYGGTVQRSTDMGKTWERAEEIGLPEETELKLEKVWHVRPGREPGELWLGAAPGAQFFLRKKFDKALDAEVASIIAMSVAHSHGCLAARARETAQIKLQTPAEHGRPEVMIMNVACLVDKAAAGEFKRTLAQLRTEFAAQGLVYELTGPWPAYHFVSSGREGLADAAASDQ